MTYAGTFEVAKIKERKEQLLAHSRRDRVLATTGTSHCASISGNARSGQRSVGSFDGARLAIAMLAVMSQQSGERPRGGCTCTLFL
jgi:hypothetical protein